MDLVKHFRKQLPLHRKPPNQTLQLQGNSLNIVNRDGPFLTDEVEVRRLLAQVASQDDWVICRVGSQPYSLRDSFVCSFVKYLIFFLMHP